MPLWAIIIYVIAAYAAFSTLFTPVVMLIVNPDLRKQAGFSKSIYGIICILVTNISFCVFAFSFQFITLLVWTLIGEVILWEMLTISIKELVVVKFVNSWFAFRPIFKSRLENVLAQPLSFLVLPTGIFSRSLKTM